MNKNSRKTYVKCQGQRHEQGKIQVPKVCAEWELNSVNVDTDLSFHNMFRQFSYICRQFFHSFIHYEMCTLSVTNTRKCPT